MSDVSKCGAVTSRVEPGADSVQLNPESAPASSAATTEPPNSNTRYTLAVIDTTIIDLSVEADSARKMAQEATTRAERLDSFKARLMGARDALRPLLDPSAPREYPYDKR